MTVRYAAVFSVRSGDAGGPVAPQPPPGIDLDDFRLALLEDTYEVVAGLEQVSSALVLDPAAPPAAEAITWPGTAIVREATADAAFAALHRLGGQEAALVAPDAPDLPPLLIGKLFRALGSAPVAVCPAEGGGLVALAARLPAAAWLTAALTGTPTAPTAPPDAAAPAIGLDSPDALRELRAAAPRSGLVYKGPGWHRLRALADLRLLDPGLEGWENTRALLAGHPLPQHGL